MRLTAEGIRVESGAAFDLWPWENLAVILDIKNGVLIYARRFGWALNIPRAAFGSTSEMTEFAAEGNRRLALLGGAPSGETDPARAS
ncbi:MAG: hypothetical protein ACKVVT_09950 [Dehalococcoidia bacterium]